MIKNTILLLASILSLASCGQTKQNNETSGLSIDPNIKTEVEKHIESIKEFDYSGKDGKTVMQIYANTVTAEFYENDSLIFKSNDNAKKMPFKSFYLWNKDNTLTIDGAYGLFGGFGFTISIHKNKATVYHMLSSDDFPTYAYKEKDSLQFRLEVPCTDTKIVLSEMPDPVKKQIIYGYVEFKSSDYYSMGNSGEGGKEILTKKKQRANMKIYFKSSKLEY